ncbi:MAG: (d)CMP kinase [Planctomycetia bacterium]|nr:(d)CMP kinase [Planctomycetia bacterium]
MIITIDGPAGAGKSTVARALAEAIGFEYLNTGAMYRALAWVGLQRQIDWTDSDAIGRLGQDLRLRIDGPRTFWETTDVTDAVRTPEVTAVTHYTADHPGLRRILAQFQRQYAEGRNVVTEGRDQGTFVFPDAVCKIYLTATPQERTRRRIGEMIRRGELTPDQTTSVFDEILAKIVARDRGDETRMVAPLRKAEDAVELMTDGMSIDQVVHELVRIVRRRSYEDATRRRRRPL